MMSGRWAAKKPCPPKWEDKAFFEMLLISSVLIIGDCQLEVSRPVVGIIEFVCREPIGKKSGA